LIKPAFLCIWIDSDFIKSYHQKSLTWGESSHEFFNLITSKSIQNSLNRIMETLWHVLNRFKIIWIVSTFMMGLLNRFKNGLIRINLHSLFIVHLAFSCLNRFKHLMNRFTMLFLAEIFHLPPFSIYTHFLITSKPFNHLHLFSLESPNLIVHLFLRLDTFSKNHCESLSHRFLECYWDCKLIAFKDMDWESRI